MSIYRKRYGSKIMQIVAMVNWKDKIMVASPDSVYEMVAGKPVLVASPDDFRKADEEWARTHKPVGSR